MIVLSLEFPLLLKDILPAVPTESFALILIFPAGEVIHPDKDIEKSSVAEVAL